MIIRTSALWACLLVASASVAQQKIYTVRQGDTPERIAKITGTSLKAIRQSNPGLNDERLQIGQKIVLYTKGSSAKKAVSKAQLKTAMKPVWQAVARSGRAVVPRTYTVRNGDHDVSIALKFGVSAYKIRAMNTGVKWQRLQIGQKLSVPGTVAVAAAPRASKKIEAKSSRTASRIAKFGPTKKHAVRKGENDWIIARKGGVTVAALHCVNPGLQWSRLQLGQKINVPIGVVRRWSYASIPTKRAIVNASNVYVRSRPSTASADIRQVGAGAVGTILDREKGWYKLRFASGSTGWVKGSLLKPMKASTYVASNRKPSKRSNNRVSYAKNLTPTKRNYRSPIVKSSGQYYTARPVSSSSLINKAYDYLGTRYRYGGTSRSGIDCSGFVQAVYSSQGVKLPRTSAAQSKVGKSVGKGDLKPGDLVFFRTRGGSRVSHAGMAVGNGKFIHASSGKGHVTTSSLNDGYYQRRFAGARRVSSKVSKASKPADADRKAMANAEKQLKGGDGVDPKPEPGSSGYGSDEITR